MLFGREAIVALGAETVVLDIGGLVPAVRHLVERHVGDLGERVVELP